MKLEMYLTKIIFQESEMKPNWEIKVELRTLGANKEQYEKLKKKMISRGKVNVSYSDTEALVWNIETVVSI